MPCIVPLSYTLQISTVLFHLLRGKRFYIFFNTVLHFGFLLMTLLRVRRAQD